MQVYLYILEGQRNYFYCGITKDVVRRIQEHNAGKSKSTRWYAPLVIKYLTVLQNYSDARKVEVSIKGTGVKRYLDRVRQNGQLGMSEELMRIVGLN